MQIDTIYSCIKNWDIHLQKVVISNSHIDFCFGLHILEDAKVVEFYKFNKIDVNGSYWRFLLNQRLETLISIIDNL